MDYPTNLLSCTGCQCCRQLCPAGAITMEEDPEGFPAPVIDQQKCTGCGLCAERCPSNRGPALQKPRRVVGARYVRDDSRLAESSSGGACYALAERFLTDGNAIVFGAALDQDNICRHIGISDISELHRLQGSKYVQSDIGDTYRQAEQALRAGKRVLFTGTPCQIAGLYQYLGTQYENLFTVDLICHGVPSPALFRLYVQYLEEKELGGKIVYFNFRSKAKRGWGAGTFLAKTKARTQIILKHNNRYMLAFSRNNCLRECCYRCQYARAERVADITVGDFWGVKKTHPEFYDRRGCSVCLINTPKGERLAGILMETCSTIDAMSDEVLSYNPNLSHPSSRPDSRDHLLRDIRSRGTDIFLQKEFNYPPKVYWQKKLKYHARWILFGYNAVRIRIRRRRRR